MFRSARIKLTGWYLLIIMSISLVFSLIIYQLIGGEMERGFRRVEMRFRAGELGIPLPRHFAFTEKISPQLVEDLRLAKKKLILDLLVVDGIIFGFSATAGYFLAGKTLRPIEKVMEEQKRFVADASHELRTPLTALKTSIEVALREKRITAKEAKSVLKSSLEDIAGLESLSNSLLKLARYQQGNGSLVFEPVNINKVAKNAFKKISPLAEKKRIRFRTRTSAISLQANEQSLEEMLVIFLDNAVKYTPKGGAVSLSAKSDKNSLVIKVKDTGIGISKEEIPHIFDRFYRVDQSRSRKRLRGDRLERSKSSALPAGRHGSSDGESAGGFGLGLSLAKRIIELHKGSVEVESTKGKGTTFTIKLPVKHS